MNSKLFFLIPIILLLTLVINIEAFAEPIKIKHERGGEIWDLYGNGTMVYVSTEPNVFNNATIYPDGNNQWVSIDFDIQGNDNFDILSGRIGTRFLDNIVKHYNIINGLDTSIEKINLLRLNNTVFENIPLTFVSRTSNESFDPIAQIVSGINVIDTIHTVTITETWSSAYGNLIINYIFIEGMPLKHTITFQQISSDSETYQLHIIFDLIIEEIEIESKINSSFNKIKIKTGEIEWNEQITTTKTFDKATFGEIIRVLELKTITNDLILGEIVAPSTTHPAWNDFIELSIDATADPTFTFKYGNWTISQGQSFQLDPDTYSSTNPTEDGHVTTSPASGAACPAVWNTQSTSSDNNAMIIQDDTDSVTNACWRNYFEYDITSIDDTADVINTVFTVEAYSLTNMRNCTINSMEFQPSVRTIQQIADDIADGTSFILNDSACTTAQVIVYDLGSDADTDVESQLSANWFAVGGKIHDEVRDTNDHQGRFASEENGVQDKPLLEITYNIPTTFVVDLLDVYESSSTTLDSGTAVCLNVDLEIASSCPTALNNGNTYRFEIEVDNTGGADASPTSFDLDAMIAASDVFGSIPVGNLLNSGCSTNTDWIESIQGGTDARAVAGTTCLIPNTTGSVEFWMIVTLDTDADDDTGTFSITDGTTSDTSTTTTFTVNSIPNYVIDLLDVFESSSTTLESGTAVCLNVDLESASSCLTALDTNTTYRFEVEIDNIGETAGSPTSLEFRDVIANSDVLGSIALGDIVDSGCSTNIDWTESISTDDLVISSGTTCSIAPSGTVEYWIIVETDNDSNDGTGTFFITDGTITDTSTVTTFTVNPPITLTATAVSTSQIDLSWTAPVGGDPTVGYKIERESPIGGGFSVLVADTGTSTTTYSDTPLTTKIQYNYRVSAISATETSSPSNEANDTTFGVPDAVTLFTIINPTTSTLTLNWTAAITYDSPVTGHKLERESPVGGGFSILSNNIGNVTNYIDTGLSIVTQYNYRITPLSALGNGATAVANGTTVTNPPTNLIVLPDGISTVNLNMTWIAPIPSTGVNGYKIEREDPVGGGFSVIVANTSSTAVIHQDTGLVIDTFYNYRVSALTPDGSSLPSNTYSQTTFHLPNSVDDLVATPSTLIDIILTWTVPDKLYGYILGYQINHTTPAGDPLTVVIANTGNSAVIFTMTDLDPTVEYSHRVSAITIHGKNITGANIANATAVSAFVIGNVTLPTVSNPNTIPISFALAIVDSDTKDLTVTYDAAMDLRCNFAYKFARTNTNYTTLTENPLTGSAVFTNFTINDPNNDIIDVNCIDTLDSSNTGQYLIMQDTLPFVTQATDFQSGIFGTSGKFGAFDLVTILVVILSMIGFNRVNPAVGVILMVSMIGALSFYGIITSWTIVLSGLALIVMLAIITVKKV